MKTCTQCGQDKPETDFTMDKKYRKPTARCKACRVKQQVAYQRNPKSAVVRKRAVIKHRYNITLEQYDEMLERQGGCCGICGRTDPGNAAKTYFSVDHDHACCPGVRSCGKCVRGLLCLRCNNNLGWMETWMPQVQSYLNVPAGG